MSLFDRISLDESTGVLRVGARVRFPNEKHSKFAHGTWEVDSLGGPGGRVILYRVGKKGKTLAGRANLGGMKTDEFKKAAVLAEAVDRKGTGRIWVFKKPKHASMFLEVAKAHRKSMGNPDWDLEQSRKDPKKVKVEAVGSSSGVPKIPPTVLTKLTQFARAHGGKRMASPFDEERDMSLFDRLTEDTDLTETKHEPLEEMFMGRPMRYVNPRDLQYSLEDAATACERHWADRKRHRSPEGQKEMKASYDAMVKALRTAATKAKECADHCEKNDRML